jgi:hypothetical protein
MTQDEIIEMARQAGFEIGSVTNAIYAPTSCEFELKVFAKLVAAKERDRMCEQCNWSKHENATCNETNQSKVLGKS